ncbi:hypothetical protein TPHA_0P01750 [Tetrapisispora phaffii CBS 4417]|uniref:Uncharacterized protein n=1 Tax=Tetrapisispora phaffii (strain ATCC 24235 / CBS 4417 / NBRC 1672 / NRRL Y-8282 / UCD 70-5) TaxID=1071381 RepID=G8C2F4_TETPH|nr:hypothetical protein TPHA_0P01750 [Tetrapisispora phaffii CBS 4417]CCE66332.1 hypothetical protein TPHA_0P01750 [Tetrapisispora phaffii CBS 4417]
MSINFKFPESVIPGQLLCPAFDIKEENDKSIVYEYIAGPGTRLQKHNLNGTVVNIINSTLVGTVKIEEDFKMDSSNLDELNETAEDEKNHSNNGTREIKKIKVSVVHKRNNTSSEVDNELTNNLPKEGDIVLAKVTRITLQNVSLEILAVENSPVPIDSGVGSNGHGVVAAGAGSGSASYSVSQTSSDFGDPFRGTLRSQDVRATERDSVKIIECFKPGDIVRAQILSLGDGVNYYLTTAKDDLGVVFAKSGNGAGNQMYALDWETMVVPSTGATEKRKCAKPF